MERKLEYGFQEMGLCILIRNACMICEQDGEHPSKDIQPSAVETSDYVVWALNQAYAGKGEDPEKYYDLEFDKNSFHIPIYECFTSVQKMLGEVFLSKQESDQLRKRIEHVIAARKKLLAAVDREHPFPPYETVVSYLDDYYRLLKACFCMRESIKESGLLEKGFLEQILNLDYEEQYVSLYAPPVLLGLRNLYDSLSGYREVIRLTASRQRYAYYREVFISKTLRLFRWYTVRNGEVYHAAIPSFCGKRHDTVKWKLQIPVRPIEEYSSYEGIGEMRLLDKVLYEVDRRGNELPERLHISILGDIGPQPMQTLCDTLNEMCCDHSRLSEIEIQVYSKNTEYIDETERRCRAQMVSCQFHPYSGQLKNPSDVTKIIEDSDICFVLDCCDIYTGFEVKPLADTERFWQRIATDDYDKNYRQIGGMQNLCRRGNLADLLNVLTAFAWKGTTGTLHKSENTSLMTYIENECKRCNKNCSENGTQPAKSVYIYVSDVGAFRDFYSSSNRFVRVERYREKEIAIIRFSNFVEADLKQHNDPYRKIIVFNVWQMVKHVSIRHWEELVTFTNSNERLPLLRNILIGIHYENWPSELKFSYYIPEEHRQMVSEEKLKNWLTEVILPFFQTGSSNIYNVYFIKSMGSFLYSDAKSLDDMLFLHVFMNQHDKLQRAVLLEGNQKQLDDLKRMDGKYSQKRFYGDVMRDYDTSSERFALKYAKLDRIEIESKGKLDRRTIFENIIQACKENHYADSYLYYNCLKML